MSENNNNAQKTWKPRILLDMDGVMNEYKGGYREDFIPEPKKGIKEFLEKLCEKFEVVVFTTRNRLVASKWLIENDIDKYITDVTNIKVPAILIIDDRCICFDGDFNNLLNSINEFKVYWNKKS